MEVRHQGKTQRPKKEDKLGMKNMQLLPENSLMTDHLKRHKRTDESVEEIDLSQSIVMLSSNREKYLGDILTTDGRRNSNIEDIYNKGIGIGIGLLTRY